jgi:hypothetical protein
LFEDFLFSGLGACAVLCFCLWLVSLILMFYIISNTAPFQKKNKQRKCFLNFFQSLLETFLTLRRTD